MDLLNKLTIKNLKLNKKRTIVTIIGIMLSVALITAVAGMYFSGVESLKKWEADRKGNFHYVFKDVPVNDVANFKNNRKIENVFLCKHIGYAEIKESKNQSKPYVHIMSFSKEALDNLAIKMVDGRLPYNENEIVIPTHLKTNGRVAFNVGDTIKLNVGKRVNEDGELTQNDSYSYENQEKIIDANTKEYKIVGIMERPSYFIEDYSAPGYTFITLLNEKNITGNVDVYTRYTKEGLKNSYKITANIMGIDENLYERVCLNEFLTEKELEKYQEEISKAKYGLDVNSNLIIIETNPTELAGEKITVVVPIIVCLIIVFTSVFCIKNSFDISITEKKRQYGMLRSIGATKKQIKKNVLYEAFILGLIGIPLGIFLGFLATYILIIVSNFLLKGMLLETYNLELKFVFSWLTVLCAILLGIITIYLSARKSAKKAGKVSPIDSIRNNEEIKITARELKTPKIITKLFGIGGEISFKNIKRNKSKYRTTVISILVSIASFVALTSFVSFAFEFVKQDIKAYDYDVGVFLSRNTKIANKKLLETTKLEDAERYSIVREKNIEIDNTRYSDQYKNLTEKSHIALSAKTIIDIYSVGDAEFRDYVKKLGLNYEQVKDKAILMDKVDVLYYNTKINKTVTETMKEFAYKKGDIISGSLSIDKSKLNYTLEEGQDSLEKDFSIEIAFVTTEKPLGVGRGNIPFIVVSDEVYNSKVLENDQIISLYFKSNNPNKLQDEIEELLQDYSISAYNVSEQARNMESFFLLVAIFLYGFIIVISLIGITNVFNTITTNVNLRRREFAMLKSVGMTKKEFRRMIRLESIFVGMKSLVFGLPIGIGLSYLIYHFLLKESGVSYQTPINAICICTVVVFLLIATIMKYSINKINKQNIIETIRNENI